MSVRIVATDAYDPYIADEELTIAAQVAIELGQPLLLTGEPGTGKTTFAHHLATTLAPRYLARPDGPAPTPFALFSFETKSTSVATDLFYRFDSLRRFHAVHDKSMAQESREYLSFEALGQAIVGSLTWERVSDLIPRREDHAGPQRSVVLIDEIDKAPRDFPNDLLNEIQRMFFRIPEVMAPNCREIRRVEADPALRPIVVLTSNSEKNLPPPFLRRCIFHHIAFPGREHADRLRRIVAANLGGSSRPLADEAIDLFYDIREELQLEKPPTSHELVQWIRVLEARARASDRAIASLADMPPAELRGTLGTIAKTTEDLKKVALLIQTRVSLEHSRA